MEIFQRLWNDFWNCLPLCLWLRASSQWTPTALRIHMSNCICFQVLARYDGVLAVASGNISVLHKSLLCRRTHKILLVTVLMAAKSRVYSKHCSKNGFRILKALIRFKYCMIVLAHYYRSQKANRYFCCCCLIQNLQKLINLSTLHCNVHLGTLVM